MANTGTVRTPAQLFTDALLQNDQPGIIRYAGQIIGDASAAASELFINGLEDNRFYLPTNSYVFGIFVGAAWNETDGDAPGGAIIYFGCENDGGTVALAPTNLRATDGNDIVEFAGEAGTFAVAADDTNKAVTVSFTPTNDDTYKVAGTLHYAFAGAGMKFSNFFSQTN